MLYLTCLILFVNKTSGIPNIQSLVFIFLCNIYSSKEETQDNDKEEFLFVHQSSWQRRLLSMYGSEICLLDATYCVCKFEVALFFICVCTNIGYVTVGCFLIPAETVNNICRGLRILKQWNKDWSPSFFMTDYDQKEITAIESTFPGNAQIFKFVPDKTIKF
jgi:hypothetical protein